MFSLLRIASSVCAAVISSPPRTCFSCLLCRLHSVPSKSQDSFLFALYSGVFVSRTTFVLIVLVGVLLCSSRARYVGIRFADLD